MKHIASVTAIFLAFALAAAAQDDPNRLSAASSGPVLQEQEPGEQERPERVRPGFVERHERFKVEAGPRVGFFRQDGADHGTWTVGIQARTWLMEFVGLEASAEATQSRFLDDNVTVSRFPLQLSAILSPLPGLDFRPYVLAGGGVHIVTTDVDGDFIGVDEDSDTEFAAHVGAGFEADVTPSVSLNADARGIWLDEDEIDFEVGTTDETFDAWQATGSLNIRF